MDIDFSLIKEVYGEDILLSCSENIEDLVSNISYLVKLGFFEVNEIVERYPIVFLCDKDEFKERVDKLILDVGNIEEFSYNMSLWEALL